MREMFSRLLTKGKAFWQIDKVAHLLASTLICILIGSVMIVRIGPWEYDAVVVPYIISAMLTMFIGLGKEAYDHYFGGTDESGDLIADAWGVLLGELFLLLIFL